MVTNLHRRNWLVVYCWIYDRHLWSLCHSWSLFHRFSTSITFNKLTRFLLYKNQAIFISPIWLYLHWNISHRHDFFVIYQPKYYSLWNFDWNLWVFYGGTVQLNAFKWLIQIHTIWATEDGDVRSFDCNYKLHYHINNESFDRYCGKILSFFEIDWLKLNSIQGSILRIDTFSSNRFNTLGYKKILWEPTIKLDVRVYKDRGKKLMMGRKLYWNGLFHDS